MSEPPTSPPAPPVEAPPPELRDPGPLPPPAARCGSPTSCRTRTSARAYSGENPPGLLHPAACGLLPDAADPFQGLGIASGSRSPFRWLLVAGGAAPLGPRVSCLPSGCGTGTRESYLVGRRVYLCRGSGNIHNKERGSLPRQPCMAWE